MNFWFCDAPCTQAIGLLCILLVVGGCGASNTVKGASSPATSNASASEAQSGLPLHAQLPSWVDGESKRRIVAFVEAVTAEGGKDYVPPAERIAVFDNDGTLIGEQPLYVQLAFAQDRVAKLSAKHPGWNKEQPFRAVLDGKIEEVLAGDSDAITTLIEATHSGMTPEVFLELAGAFMRDMRHPKTGRPYVRMVFQPMIELLSYFRAHGFSLYICSGGGSTFIRSFSEEAYGLSREQVIGSRIALGFEDAQDGARLMRAPKLALFNNGSEKPASIQYHLGRRPIAAFGNSDGDLEMLDWVSAGQGLRLAALVHHTDAEREWAYDRESNVGKLDRALDKAAAKGWVRIDMKHEWTRIYPADGR